MGQKNKTLGHGLKMMPKSWELNIKKVGKDVNIYHRLRREKGILVLIDKESGNEIKIMPTNY